MKTPSFVLTLLLSLGLYAPLSHAGWQDWLNSASEMLQQQPQANSALSNAEIVKGLKAALAQGTRSAVNQLGQQGGFLDSPRFKVPLPPALAASEDKLRKLGLGGLLDQFSLSLNRAAEQAVPEVADIFANSIEAMTVNDAVNILQGDDDAATRYFEATTSGDLNSRIKPLVSTATEQAGVTQAYKALTANAGPLLAMLAPQALDLDQFVTSKAMDGLFTAISDEEKRIRENPSARGSEILRQVFGG